jgi:hypothetical protein
MVSKRCTFSIYILFFFDLAPQSIMKLRNYKIYSVLFFSLCSNGFSQNGGPPPPGLPDEEPVLPINQGANILLFAGVVLGAYVISNRNKL